MSELEKQQKKLESFYKSAISACIDHDFKKLGLCYYGIKTCLQKIEQFKLEAQDELYHVPINEFEQGKIL